MNTRWLYGELMDIKSTENLDVDKSFSTKGSYVVKFKFPFFAKHSFEFFFPVDREGFLNDKDAYALTDEGAGVYPVDETIQKMRKLYNELISQAS